MSPLLAHSGEVIRRAGERGRIKTLHHRQHGQAKRLRSLQVYHQFEFSRRFHREVPRLVPFENPIDVEG